MENLNLPINPDQETTEDTQAPTPEELEESETSEQEITLKLNPVQLFAIRETVLNAKFIGVTNEIIDRVDNGTGSKLWEPKIFNGEFKGVFRRMHENTENNQMIAENMAAALVNLFMAHVVAGSAELETPVNRDLIKDFLKTEEPVKEDGPLDYLNGL